MRRGKRIKRARKLKKIFSTIGIACGCISFLLMGGVDGENWLAVAIAMMLFLLAAVGAGIVSEYYNYKIHEMTHPEPWGRGFFV